MLSSKSSEYGALTNAIHRCHNEDHSHYYNYGARGIEVCEEWRDLTNGGFAKFLAHIGCKPSPDLSLDRIDNELGYRPGNVRWATRSEQQNNIRTNRSVEDRDLINQIIALTGCSRRTAAARVKQFKKSGNDTALFSPLRHYPGSLRKCGNRQPAILKPVIRNSGENRHARNLSIAADWDADVPSAEICENHNISGSSLFQIVKGKQ